MSNQKVRREFMVKIHNRLNQKLIISLTGSNNLEILAKGTATISEKDFNSPHLQALITRGEIVVYSSAKSDTKDHPVSKGETKVHPAAKEETTVHPVIKEKTTVRPDTEAETTIHPGAGEETTARPNQAGKGASVTANKNGVSNAGVPSKGSTGKE
jgi:hypothetical protein